jgi:hypothetical protein
MTLAADTFEYIPYILILVIGLVVGGMIGAVIALSLSGSNPKTGKRAERSKAVIGEAEPQSRIEAFTQARQAPATPVTADSKKPTIPIPTTQSYTPGVASSVTPPSLELGDVISNVFVTDPKPKKAEVKATTIAEQVDEILQGKLESSRYSGRTIKILEVPQRGMVVVVDSMVYDGVAEVADEEVRKFIQECVAEWEASRYPQG